MCVWWPSGSIPDAQCESRRATAARLGLAEWLAKEVQECGRAEVSRPVPLTPSLVERALRAVPIGEREQVASEIAEATRLVSEGLLREPLAALARLVRRHPAVAPVLAVLERHAVRTELAQLRYDAARALLFQTHKPEPFRHNPFTKEGL